jgi:hypothetical protein
MTDRLLGDYCSKDEVESNSSASKCEASVCGELEYDNDDEQARSEIPNCSRHLNSDVVEISERGWFARRFDMFAKGVGATLPASVAVRRNFPVPVSFRLAVQLVVGSFCCMAAAMQATEPVWLLLRASLALVSIGGFTRLFGRCRAPPLYRQTQIPMLCIANYLKIALVAITASVAATAATFAATIAMMMTAATVYWRAAWDYGVGRERRRWYANLGGFVLDLLELGALLLQMVLMTQVFFLPHSEDDTIVLLSTRRRMHAPIQSYLWCRRVYIRPV